MEWIRIISAELEKMETVYEALELVFPKLG